MLESVSAVLGYCPIDIGFCKSGHCDALQFYGVSCMREVML